MVQNATLMGANAVISMRFDTSEIGQTMSEIVAYGTAVVVVPDAARATAHDRVAGRRAGRCTTSSGSSSRPSAVLMFVGGIALLPRLAVSGRSELVLFGGGGHPGRRPGTRRYRSEHAERSSLAGRPGWRRARPAARAALPAHRRGVRRSDHRDARCGSGWTHANR